MLMKICRVVLLLLLPATLARADWFDTLKKTVTSTNQTAGTTALAGLGETEIINGLKEALAKGVTKAVNDLGKDGGFLTNLAVKIPMPEKLHTVEKGLRAAGQNQIADEFVTTMNHAAEQAVPVAATVF